MRIIVSSTHNLTDEGLQLGEEVRPQLGMSINGQVALPYIDGVLKLQPQVYMWLPKPRV